VEVAFLYLQLVHDAGIILYNRFVYIYNNMPLTHNVQDHWIDHNNFLLRKDNLVYASNRKCASTYYHSLLISNGWSYAKFRDISWEQDHVFGFILEPWKRRIKGIAEDLSYYSVEKFLLSNLGRKFWLDHLTFGPHSVPLTLTWHRYSYMIDWIPLDGPVSADELLDRLLAKYNIVLDRSGQHNANPADDYQKNLYLEIDKIVGNGLSMLQLTMAADTDLYNSVVSSMDFNNTNWDAISWLK
jgi:hypothetical protein